MRSLNFLLLILLSTEVLSIFRTTCDLTLCTLEIDQLKAEFAENSTVIPEKECLDTIFCLSNLICPERERRLLVDITFDACKGLKEELKLKPETIFQNSQCQEAIDELQREVEFGESIEAQLELCEKLETCLASGSEHVLQKPQQDLIQKSCKLLGFQMDPLSRCFKKLKDTSSYLKDPCLDGVQFFDFSKLAVCKADENLNKCTLGIINSQCGFEAMKSYEIHQAVLMEIYDC